MVYCLSIDRKASPQIIAIFSVTDSSVLGLLAAVCVSSLTYNPKSYSASSRRIFESLQFLENRNIPKILSLRCIGRNLCTALTLCKVDISSACNRSPNEPATNQIQLKNDEVQP